jgi:hypothetical protein
MTAYVLRSITQEQKQFKMIEEGLTEVGLPIWVLAAAFLLNAFKGYLPTISKNITEKNDVASCKRKCKQLSNEIIALNKKCQSVDNRFDEMSKKYYLLLGSVSIIKTRLKELGFDDITKVSKTDEKGN